jgi:RNA polymerase primary sigma factor
LPLNKLVNVNKLQRLKVEIEQDLMREPTFEELREFIDSPELIADLQHLHTIIRLDAPRTEQGEASLHEVVFGASSSINEDLTNFETEFKLVIKNFPKREQDIICMYYGVGYDKCFTLREIGEELSLTRERIRQIKEGIIDKIRKRRDGKKLIVYFSQNMYNEDN